MPNAKLTVNGNEMPVNSNLLTCGRSSDNDVAFPSDSNVSRYHAEIEERGGDYWLIDLGSSNGTTVNGKKVDGEVRLNDGDKIVLGGSSEFDFAFENCYSLKKQQPWKIPQNAHKTGMYYDENNTFSNLMKKYR